MTDPFDPRANRNEPDNPGRDPNSDIFSRDPAPNSRDSDDVVEPAHDAEAPRPIDPALMAPPPVTPPPVTPPTVPGPIAALQPHNGGAILTFGVLGLVISLGSFCCILFPMAGIGCGLAATIWGTFELRSINSGRTDPSGRGAVSAGRICGIIALVIAGLGVLIQIGLMVFSSVYQQSTIPGAP